MIKVLRLLAGAAVAVLLLSSGVTAMEDDDIRLEVDSDNGVLRLHAVSFGCTRAADFDVVRTGDGKYAATRTRPDWCRRRPFEVVFEYPLDAVADEPLPEPPDASDA